MSMADHRMGSFHGLLDRESKYQEEGFLAGFADNVENLENARVLVVGAGGLGCEILKNLALSGFKQIHTIDMDTIDISNLNRQFLFRKKDVGHYKAEVAAKFIMARCEGVTVDYSNKAIQEWNKEWYTQFDLIVAGLDSVKARRWLNELVHDLTKLDKDGNVDWDTVIPLIDGGTEGFKGQTRLFYPRTTSCFECSMDSMPQGGPHFHLCTLASVPRIPEHCIAFAHLKLWNQLSEYKSATEFKLADGEAEPNLNGSVVQLDKDNEDHCTWIFNQACKRADAHKIPGVTPFLTMQVIKNIIPAIASTNALISAACVNEALKVRTLAAKGLNNFFAYNGKAGMGISSDTIDYARKDDCSVCAPPAVLQVKASTTVKELYDMIYKIMNEKSVCKDILVVDKLSEKLIFSTLDIEKLGVEAVSDVGIVNQTLVQVQSTGRQSNMFIFFE